ncbi:ArsR/SmtB family transcription factor [Streptomyces sp. NPDC051218]|uniref:ArsR/SmtB family transcription factor n=1 Tax=Streptomyces sp. NPDC051218 TaxID=3365645 RepID=UPI0037A86145
MENVYSDAQLVDPGAMRALTHATRLRLLAQLRIRGPQTVGALSDALDEAVGNVSYHIRQLAAHGLVKEVPELARDRRERWWSAAHPKTVLGPFDPSAHPERAEAARALRHAILRRYVDQLEAYLDSEDSLEGDWARNAVGSDSILHLTAGQLGELKEELEELASRWEARSNDQQHGAHPVALIYHAFQRPQ